MSQSQSHFYKSNDLLFKKNVQNFMKMSFYYNDADLHLNGKLNKNSKEHFTLRPY